MSYSINLGTAQVKDIKPGVLSKITTLIDKDSNGIADPKTRKLVSSAKDIQDSLLEYANFKPTKKVFVSESEALNSKAQSLKDLVERIQDFK